MSHFFFLAAQVTDRQEDGMPLMKACTQDVYICIEHMLLQRTADDTGLNVNISLMTLENNTYCIYCGSKGIV